MDLITLAEFKAHARIVGDDEDGAAQSKVDAANAYVSGFLPAMEDEEAYEPPEDLKQAALLIASNWWEHRETSFPGALIDIPADASALLLNHQDFAF